MFAAANTNKKKKKSKKEGSKKGNVRKAFQDQAQTGGKHIDMKTQGVVAEEQLSSLVPAESTEPLADLAEPAALQVALYPQVRFFLKVRLRPTPNL